MKEKKLKYFTIGWDFWDDEWRHESKSKSTYFTQSVMVFDNDEFYK